MSCNWYLTAEKAAKDRKGSAAAPGTRRVLAMLGPTWAASPARRFLQTAFLILFLVLFFYVCWPYGSPDYVATMRSKELIPAETFLDFDPLVPLSTALAARAWVWVPVWTHFLIWLCILFPRAFCGYVCPLGTLADLFDWAVGRRVNKHHVRRRGWWVHLKWYLLVGTLVASACGVLVTGYVAAIPVVTRGMMFAAAPLELGLRKGWYLVPAMNAGQWLSLVLFAAVLALGVLRPRFWCSYLCPTGATFSAGAVLRVNERKVEASCIGCGRCVEVCPFDAIKPDFTTRVYDCTFCQTCGGVCPVGAIQFGGRWKRENLRRPAAATGETVAVLSQSGNPLARCEAALSRRGFLAGAAGGVAAFAAIQKGFGAGVGKPGGVLPVRPPGSVPEQEFLQLCIRCGACFQACPNNVLQPVSFEQGLEGIWTPQVVAKWSGCEPKCNNCGQVCPTGAIRPLPLEEKRAARIGLAVVNERTCLPYARREACQMCVDECRAAGYDAIEFVRVGAEMDRDGKPVEDSGFLAPVVLADQCVGCGLCETRCYKINMKEKRLIDDTAIHVVAGEGKEDRLMRGSYVALREEERRKKQEEQQKAQKQNGAGDGYLPDFLK